MYDRQAISRSYVSGNGIPMIHGDGVLDILKSIGSTIWGIAKPILSPVLGIAKNTLLPAITGAISSGSTDGLKEAALSTFKQAMPGIMDRASTVALDKLKSVEALPDSVKEQLLPALGELSKAGQAKANKYIEDMGDGMRKKRSGRKKIDKLVSGSGLFKY